MSQSTRLFFSALASALSLLIASTSQTLAVAPGAIPVKQPLISQAGSDASVIKVRGFHGGGFRGGGFHGGGFRGGFRGGGFRSGGFSGGGPVAGGFRGGGFRGGGFHGGFGRRHFSAGPFIAGAVIGGALASPYYARPYYYGAPYYPVRRGYYAGGVCRQRVVVRRGHRRHRHYVVRYVRVPCVHRCYIARRTVWSDYYGGYVIRRVRVCR